MFKFFVAFLIFLIFPIFETSAKTVLTTGQETVNAHFSYSPHPFFGKRVTIEQFDRNAQCYPEPGANTIGSYSLELQLGGDAMLGDVGLTICYVGQLDPTFTIRGMAPSMPYRISNKQNHPLAKLCEEAKAKLMEGNDCRDPECYEFVIREWHAIQFKQHPNGRDLEMKMSTVDVNYSFRIPRDQLLKNGSLVFKFTTANEYTARFSKSIGPAKQVGRRPTVEEKKSVVKVETDEKMEFKYFENVFAGARLEKFNAPYAVTVDFFPSLEGIHDFDIFVIRSECSDVPTMFTTPTDSISIEPRAALQYERHEKIDLEVNSTTFFRGYVFPNAKEFSFEYKMRRTIDLKSVKMIVTFDGKKEYGNVVFNATKGNITVGLEGNLDGIRFYKGEQFLLKATSMDSHFLVSINCGKVVKISRGKDHRGQNIKISGIQRIEAKVKGDVEVRGIWNSKPVASNQYVAIFDDLHLAPNYGFMIIAKPTADWQEIFIELQKKKKSKEEEEEIDVVLKFEANQATYKLGINVPLVQQKEGKEQKDIKGMIEANEPFEFHFILYDGHIDLYLNDTHCWRIPMKNPKVDIIQIEADFKLVQKLKTIGTPSLIKLNQTLNEGKSLSLRGKVFKDAKSFEIQFYESLEAFNESECFIEKSVACITTFFINVNFTNGIKTIGDYKIDWNQGGKKVPKELPSNGTFHRGQNFEITVSREVSGFKVVYGNGKVDTYNVMKTSASYIKLTGNIYILEISGPA